MTFQAFEELIVYLVFIVPVYNFNEKKIMEPFHSVLLNRGTILNIFWYVISLYVSCLSIVGSVSPELAPNNLRYSKRKLLQGRLRCNSFFTVCGQSPNNKVVILNIKNVANFNCNVFLLFFWHQVEPLEGWKNQNMLFRKTFPKQLFFCVKNNIFKECKSYNTLCKVDGSIFEF